MKYDVIIRFAAGIRTAPPYRIEASSAELAIDQVLDIEGVTREELQRAGGGVEVNEVDE